MDNKLTYFTLALAILGTSLVACIDKNKTENKSTQSIPSKVLEEKEEVPKLLSKNPRVGSIKELGKDASCEKFGGIIAYAQTSNYQIYICGDVEKNKPHSMVIVNIIKKSTGRERTVIKDNPSVLWNKSYLFGSREVGVVLNKPFVSTVFIKGKPEFYTFASFAEEFFIREEIITYLFNPKTTPNYTRSTLTSNKAAAGRLEKFLPTFATKFRLCSDSLEVEENLPKRTIVVTPKRVILPKELSAFEISPKKYLVESVCFFGAYNPTIQYYLYSEESSKQKLEIIPFDILQSLNKGKFQKIKNYTVSGVPRFFPEDNTLRVFHKGVGAGGCGDAAEYKLTGERFELLEFRKYDCFGYKSPKDWKSKSPSEFPKIYP